MKAQSQRFSPTLTNSRSRSGTAYRKTAERLLEQKQERNTNGTRNKEQGTREQRKQGNRKEREGEETADRENREPLNSVFSADFRIIAAPWATAWADAQIHATPGP